MSQGLFPASNSTSFNPFGNSNSSSAPSFPKLPSPLIFDNSQRNKEQAELMKRVQRVEDQYKKLKQEQEILRKQLEECRNNSSQIEYDELKKQMEELKLQFTESRNSRKPSHSTSLFGQQKQQKYQKFSNQEHEELRDSIATLKKICLKKDTELDYAVAIIEKQQKTIEAQTVKISGLQMQIQSGFAKLSLQLTNFNRVPSFSNQQNSNGMNFNQSSQLKFPVPFPQTQRATGPSYFEKPNFFTEDQSSFQKRPTNPLSQSAVFESRPSMFSQNVSNTYKQDGYLIKYRSAGDMIQNLEISNFVGKIEVLEPIHKKYIMGRRISEIVNIGNNVCEIIDHSWDNLHIKLTTFNFMNMQQMSLSERVDLNKKVKQQAEISGLEYSLDAMTGNLEIISKPKSNSFKF